jgi:hypothetical protein
MEIQAKITVFLRRKYGNDVVRVFQVKEDGDNYICDVRIGKDKRNKHTVIPKAQISAWYSKECNK